VIDRERIELLREAANKLVAAGMAEQALPMSEMADGLEAHPGWQITDTDTQLYLANTVDKFIQFVLMLRSA